MHMNRRTALTLAAAALGCSMPVLPALAQSQTLPPEQVLRTWNRLILELVRHTPTYSPPVASRSFAYVGVTAYEVAASGAPGWQSLAGQLNGLAAVPGRTAGAVYDEAVVMHAAMASATRSFFGNTGPTGLRAIDALDSKYRARVVEGLAEDVAARSLQYGESVAIHVLNWSLDDGGAVIQNMGFPLTYQLKEGPAHWVPTSLVRQQQTPLLPTWGNNRSFAMPTGGACPLPPPPPYSEDAASAFYNEALEVRDTVRNLTDEQRAIARFWSDDPMLSPTPPGHWMLIALNILDDEKAGLLRSADVLARLGIAIADGFIACWNSKFDFDLLRPVTYIRRHIDAKWEPLLITPPFPEYPSGHSTQSGAAATVLTKLYGDTFAFVDTAHERDGLKPRQFASFWDAAEEAGISRLYGGIHFRAAIERGLDQGRCIGAYVNALRTGS